MDTRAVLGSQYRAALRTLRMGVERCPEDRWDAPADRPAAFWRVAYHTLFFTHMYLQRDQHAFTPWSGHRPDAQVTGASDWQGRTIGPVEPYTREQILEYWGVCEAMVEPCLAAMDLERSECGFPWYAMGKLEHQVVNIRHVQHHAAALATRLRRECGVAIDWVGGG
jgi:hypothetical protein